MTITPPDLTPAELATMAGLPHPTDTLDGLDAIDALCDLLNVETLPEILIAVAVCIQRADTLTAAAQATIAAENLNVTYQPTSWLREELDRLNLTPPPGARPTDYIPTIPTEATWGAI